MRHTPVKWGLFLAALLVASATKEALAAEPKFSVLYSFEVADPDTFASQLGSQPDTLPALGRDGAVYGMTSTGGANGNGVIYRYDMKTKGYKLLHVFSAVDANGLNEDGATPGVALTPGPDDEFYGMASFGGANGTGTVFKISATGKFSLLHAFGAVDANLHNEDGANPLRAIVVGREGSLYGTTRLGGQYTCGPKLSGCGVAWMITPSGKFSVIHQFLPAEGHAASLLQSHDGSLYGCAVYPFASAGSGILFRMAPSGSHFEVLHVFSEVDENGDNPDGADCYEPLVETEPGVFYGAAFAGGPNGNGAVFRYSILHGGGLEVVHAFGPTDLLGANSDGANPYARLTIGKDGWLYSTASYGGAYGDGVVYRLGRDNKFEILHTFSAVDPISGSNFDGADPDYGVLLDGDCSLIGMADYGGSGSVAGATGNGTLYKLQL